MYSKTSHDIRVTVVPHYLEEHSAPEEDLYVWSYTVTLENKGNRAVTLMNRHWHITDSMGRTQEVRGPGVVGRCPTLRPGERFEYTSGTHLPTASGIMMGSYEMRKEHGENVDVVIPAFSLDSPQQLLRAN